MIRRTWLAAICGGLLALIGTVALPVRCVVAQEPAATAPPVNPGPVFAKGQDEFLASMLGIREVLPGECRFSGGNAEGPSLRATYDCSTGSVTIVFRHPAATEGGRRTEKFAFEVTEGTAPEGLLDALEARVREREAKFEWLEPRENDPSAMPFGLSLPVVVAAVLIAGVLFGVWRRRSAA